MIALAIILAVLILIALLRFGVKAEYSEEGVSVSATAGPFSLKVYPRAVKGDKAKRKAQRKAEKKARKEEKKARKGQKVPKKTEDEEHVRKKAGGLDYFLLIVSSAKTALGRLRRRLLIKKLTIHFIAGNEDASKAAMMFGGANAAVGAVTPLLENSFRVKRRDLRTSVDFNAVKPAVYAGATVSLAVWEAFYVAFALLPILTKRPKEANEKSTGTKNKITGKDGQEDG